jgi:putative nucleotidyltransferase with HDIG domain
MTAAAPQIEFPLKSFFIDLFGERVYTVGGPVRDALLYGRVDPAKEIDLLVVEKSYEEVESALSPHGKTNTVGKSFAVVKFSRADAHFDISVPRRDRRLSATEHGHRNFAVDSGPHVPLADDLSRRDFTCNSIALRLCDNQLVDPFHGREAIASRRLIMTGPESFADDPLRVLRAARFASRHDFVVDPEIYRVAKPVRLDELSVERVADELVRLLLESPRPSRGLDEYLRLGVLEKLFPELYALSLTIQDAHFHPESDEQGHHTVLAHTLIAVDLAQKLAQQRALDEERRLALLLAALLHDCGKPATTRWEFKKERMTVTSALHDSQGARIAAGLLERLRVETLRHFPLRRVILLLVANHHRIYELWRHRSEINFKAVARLVKEMEGEEQLLLLLDVADRLSREPRPLEIEGEDEIETWFRARQQEYRISCESIRPLVLGRDLIPLGVAPGPEMGRLLKQLYEQQLDGEFHNRAEGVELARRLVSNP